MRAYYHQMGLKWLKSNGFRQRSYPHENRQTSTCQMWNMKHSSGRKILTKRRGRSPKNHQFDTRSYSNQLNATAINKKRPLESCHRSHLNINTNQIKSNQKQFVETYTIKTAPIQIEWIETRWICLQTEQTNDKNKNEQCAGRSSINNVWNSQRNWSNRSLLSFFAIN